MPPLPDEGPNEVRTAAFLAHKAKMLDDTLALAQPRVTWQHRHGGCPRPACCLRRLRTLLKLAARCSASFIRMPCERPLRTCRRPPARCATRRRWARRSTRSRSDNEPAGGVARASPRARQASARPSRRRLRHGELDRARTMLQAILTLPVRPDRDPVLGRFARRVVEKAREGVEAAGTLPRTTPSGCTPFASRTRSSAMPWSSSPRLCRSIWWRWPSRRRAFRSVSARSTTSMSPKPRWRAPAGSIVDTRMLVIAALEVARRETAGEVRRGDEPCRGGATDETVAPPASPG